MRRENKFIVLTHAYFIFEPQIASWSPKFYLFDISYIFSEQQQEQPKDPSLTADRNLQIWSYSLPVPKIEIIIYANIKTDPKKLSWIKN